MAIAMGADKHCTDPAVIAARLGELHGRDVRGAPLLPRWALGRLHGTRAAPRQAARKTGSGVQRNPALRSMPAVTAYM